MEIDSFINDRLTIFIPELSNIIIVIFVCSVRNMLVLPPVDLINIFSGGK